MPGARLKRQRIGWHVGQGEVGGEEDPLLVVGLLQDGPQGVGRAGGVGIARLLVEGAGCGGLTLGLLLQPLFL